MALPREYRLHLQKSFDILFKFGKTHRISFGLIKYSKKVMKWPRLAIVVTKKVAKTSVARHRIKRLVGNALDRSGFRSSIYDMMVVVQRDVSKNNFFDIEKEIVSTGLF